MQSFGFSLEFKLFTDAKYIHILQTLKELEAHIGQLTEKLDLLGKQPLLLSKNELQKHVHGLETQLTDITNRRLQHLELLQNQQTQWQVS